MTKEEIEEVIILGKLSNKIVEFTSLHRNSYKEDYIVYKRYLVPGEEQLFFWDPISGTFKRGVYLLNYDAVAISRKYYEQSNLPITSCRLLDGDRP